MERSGLTFMTHCWQFCERLVDDLFPLNLYLRLCWKALGKVLKKKNWKRGENLKKYRGEFKFLFPSKFSSFQFFENESFRERMISFFSRSFEKEKISKMFDRETIFFRRIFSGHRVLILAIHFSNIFRVLIDKARKNANGVILRELLAIDSCCRCRYVRQSH